MQRRARRASAFCLLVVLLVTLSTQTKSVMAEDPVVNMPTWDLHFIFPGQFDVRGGFDILAYDPNPPYLLPLVDVNYVAIPLAGIPYPSISLVSTFSYVEIPLPGGGVTLGLGYLGRVDYVAFRTFPIGIPGGVEPVANFEVYVAAFGIDGYTGKNFNASALQIN